MSRRRALNLKEDRCPGTVWIGPAESRMMSAMTAWRRIAAVVGGGTFGGFLGGVLYFLHYPAANVGVIPCGAIAGIGLGILVAACIPVA